MGDTVDAVVCREPCSSWQAGWPECTQRGEGGSLVAPLACTVTRDEIKNKQNKIKKTHLKVGRWWEVVHARGETVSVLWLLLSCTLTNEMGMKKVKKEMNLIKCLGR
jgi:hypothetical protein